MFSPLKKGGRPVADADGPSLPPAAGPQLRVATELSGGGNDLPHSNERNTSRGNTIFCDNSVSASYEGIQLVRAVNAWWRMSIS
jgi:hypothetical protein